MKNISIIIPSYNSEKTIVPCIESVVRECSSCNLSYEILAIDDGSTDSSPELIQSMSLKDRNIVYIHQENAGPSAARNNGLSKATGELIAFIDSDDIWLEGKLKLQLEYMNAHPDVELIGCKYFGASNFNTEKFVTFKDMSFHNYFATPTVIFKNTAQNVRFPENMKYSEDMRFFLTIMLDHKAGYIPFVGARNYSNKSTYGDSGLSSHLRKMEAGELSNLRFIFKHKRISLPLFLFAYIYSIAKFFRRCIISAIRKIKK